MQQQPMSPADLGRYVCVAPGGCRRSPAITIEDGQAGVWYRTEAYGTAAFSSAHRGCLNPPVDAELFARTAPRWNCVDYPDGMHYLDGAGACRWCGATAAQIAADGRTRPPALVNREADQ